MQKFPEAPGDKLELHMPENEPKGTRRKLALSAETFGLETPIFLLLLVESHVHALRYAWSLFYQ